MDIRLLRYFLAIVREENISRAAEMLYVTQPALSRQMTQMEEELGSQLFVRGKHLQLTDAGIMLRRRAEEVVQLMEKIEDEFQEQDDVAGVISIGSGGLPSAYILPEIMESFWKKHPKVHYAFYTNNADNVKECLDRGLLDFGLLLEPIDIGKYDYIRMKEKERWGVLMRTDHPPAQKESITAEDIRDLPLITTNRATLQKELANWLGTSPEQLNIFATYNIITNVAMLVDSGIACALTIVLFCRSMMSTAPMSAQPNRKCWHG